MPAPPFSSFRRKQIAYELRYDNAYLLWDRTGWIWTHLKSHVGNLTTNTVSPNRTVFFADGRYSLSVSLDRASIIDERPEASADSTFELITAFSEIVLSGLEVAILTRAGTRFQYSIECRNLNEAKNIVNSMHMTVNPNKKLFNIEPASIAPAYKVEVNDGALGYIFQAYAQELVLQLEPLPDIISLIGAAEKKVTSQFVIDIDFMTKNPLPVESFDAKTWLSGWQKAINRDMDAMLNLRSHTDD